MKWVDEQLKRVDARRRAARADRKVIWREKLIHLSPSYAEVAWFVAKHRWLSWVLRKLRLAEKVEALCWRLDRLRLFVASKWPPENLDTGHAVFHFRQRRHVSLSGLQF